MLALAPDLAPPPAGWGCRVVDLEGRRLVPGLLDVHVHLLGGGGEGGPTTRVRRMTLPDFAAAGVTTVVGLLGTDCVTRTLPDLLATARGLEEEGLTALCYTGGYDVPPPTVTGSCRGDLVLVDRMVAIGEVALSDHRGSQPSDAELARLAADAHVAGMLTGKAGLLHLHLGDGPAGLDPIRRILASTNLPPRVFHPTHANRSPRCWDDARDLARLGCPVDLTALPPSDPGTVWAGDALVQWIAEGLPPGRLTLSSDAGGSLPVFDADGLLVGMDVGTSATLLPVVRHGVEHGLSLETALAPLTRTPADLYRLPRKGRIAVGADADLLVLDPGFAVHATLGRGRVLWAIPDSPLAGASC